MYKIIILLLFLLSPAYCWEEVWQDKNVSVSIPDGWEKNTPPAKDIVLFYMYQEHKVMVSLIVQKNKEGVPSKQATQNYNNAIIKKFSAEVIEKSESELNQRFISNVTIKFNIKDKVAYNKVLTTSCDGKLYSLNAMTVGKKLPEKSKLDHVFSNFRFLKSSKEKYIPSIDQDEALGELFFDIFIVVAVILIIVYLRKK